MGAEPPGTPRNPRGTPLNPTRNPRGTPAEPPRNPTLEPHQTNPARSMWSLMLLELALVWDWIVAPRPVYAFAG